MRCLGTLLLLPALASAFLIPSVPSARARTCLNVGSNAKIDVPPDLEGKLDPKRHWDVVMTLNGETKTVSVSEGTSLLDAAEEAFGDPPCMCRNGVCTTCAAEVTKGGHGSWVAAIESLSPEQRDAGFILSCQTYPCGPGLEVRLNAQEEVYESQYAKYEKKAHSELEKKKGFNIFA
ncbi:phenylacetic acid degradation protein reductase [Nannochloropsis oceanica]